MKAQADASRVDSSNADAPKVIAIIASNRKYVAFMVVGPQSHALAEPQAAAVFVPAVIIEAHVENVTIASSKWAKSLVMVKPR